jgi:hypothetical protein
MPASSSHERPSIVANGGGFEEAMERAEIRSIAALALRLGVDRSTAHRVLGGRTAPGEEFIACALAAFPDAKFEDLFEVRPQT